MARTAPIDPLADLRAADTDPGLPPADDDPTPNAPLDVAATTPAWHQDAQTAIVTRWHTDPTASSYAHAGGTCGCRYLARLALVEAVGAPALEVIPDGD